MIDVLRFSTTVAVALSLGFKSIYVFSELSDAVSFARSRGLPLSAKVHGVKPQEADLDNSPSEIVKHGPTYLGRGVSELVIRTSSGAVAVVEAIKQRYRHVYISSTVNARSVAEVLLRKGCSVFDWWVLGSWFCGWLFLGLLCSGVCVKLINSIPMSSLDTPLSDGSDAPSSAGLSVDVSRVPFGTKAAHDPQG